MKKNWMQGLSLALSVVLLVILVKQGQEIEALRSQLSVAQDTLYREIDSVPQQVMSQIRESGRLVESYQLEPAGLDLDAGTLQADLAVTLKTWREDLALSAFVTVGDEKETVDLSMGEAGVFTAPLSLPLEQGELSLVLLLSDGEEHTQEDLGGYESISMLLPLQNRSASWTEPVYQAGILGADEWPSILLCGLQGEYRSVHEPEMRLYKNGELLLTRAGVQDTVASAPDGTFYTAPEGWQVPLETGETVEFRFACTDEYGLGYEFFITGWEIRDGKAVEYCPEDSQWPDLYWE